MRETLLKSSKAKRSAVGSTYLVVPFQHGPGMGVTNSSPAQQDLTSTIKSAMKKQGIPFGKIERDQAGNAKLGKLHSFSIMDKPLKNEEGPGQGKGPLGKVRQGSTGVPFLQGVGVYQNKVRSPSGKEVVKKSILSFRTISSNSSADSWQHPGVQPARKIFEDASKEIMDIFEKEIAPGIIAKITNI